MNLSKVLNALENGWDRNEILINIKNGLGAEEIVNQFLKDNEVYVKELNNLLRPEDIDLLNQVELLSNCESKLINKIKSLNDLNDLNNIQNHHIINNKTITSNNIVSTNRFSSFMIDWSNKFVVIALLTISAIALSKQAWA